MKGNILRFQKIDIGSDILNFELNVEKYLAQIGATSLDDARAKAYGKHTDGTRSTTLVFDNGLLSFFIVKADTINIVPVTVPTPDNNPILPDNIVVYGSYVSAISVSGLITTEGVSKTFTNIFEWPQPILTDPKIDVDADANITIKAKNIKTKEGNPGYYYIAADGTPKIIVEGTVIMNLPVNNK